MTGKKTYYEESVKKDSCVGEKEMRRVFFRIIRRRGFLRSLTSYLTCRYLFGCLWGRWQRMLPLCGDLGFDIRVGPNVCIFFLEVRIFVLNLFFTVQSLLSLRLDSIIWTLCSWESKKAWMQFEIIHVIIMEAPLHYYRSVTSLFQCKTAKELLIIFVRSYYHSDRACLLC